MSTADGNKVLSFAEAQRKALARQAEARADDGSVNRKLTVKDAAESYLVWFREHRKGVAMAESAVRTHIRPAFGERQISTLKAAELRAWLDDLATAPARLRTSKFATKAKERNAPKCGDEKLARKASANRIYTVLRAILNRAFQNGHVASDQEWRKVKPFPKVDEARISFLTDAESVRLVNACPADLRAPVRAALLTGARRGELAGLHVGEANTNRERPTVYVAESKSGKPRYIPLNDEGRAAIRITRHRQASRCARVPAGRRGHNRHIRALTVASPAAKIRPAVSFHELRHAYASHLAQAGIPLLTISRLLGHADSRITARHYAHLGDKTLAAAVTSLPSFAPNKRSVVTEVRKTRAA